MNSDPGTTSPTSPAPRSGARPNPSSRPPYPADRTCFICKRPGHLRWECPRAKTGPPGTASPVTQALSQTPPAVRLVGGRGTLGLANRQPVTVGKRVVTGFRDSGAEVTLVQPEVIPPESILPGRTMTLKGIGQNPITVPMAHVLLDWGAGRGPRDVGVMSDLPANVLLGTDLGPMVTHYGTPAESPLAGGDSTAAGVDIACPVRSDDSVSAKIDMPSLAGIAVDVNVDLGSSAPLPVGAEVGKVKVSNPSGAALSARVDKSYVNEVFVVPTGEKPATTEDALKAVMEPATGTDNVNNAMLLVNDIMPSGNNVCCTPDGRRPSAGGIPVPAAEVPVTVGCVPSVGSVKDNPVIPSDPQGAPSVAVVTRSQSRMAASQPALDDPSLTSEDDPEIAVTKPLELGPSTMVQDPEFTTLLAENSQEFSEAVRADSSLEALRQRADQPPRDSDKDRVFWDQGRLYRETLPGVEQGDWRKEKHLIVPRPYREELLRLAHDIPLAGHLGVAKTKARLAHLFYWPKLGAEVAKYCRSCETCQRMGKAGRRPKAPLVPMPIILEPFQRVAVDLIGPLSVPSPSGKRFILTVVDYATRYPEAVPLTSARADVVAKALVQIFTRVGFPKELLTDQGTQFMSALVKGLLKYSGVEHLTSAPYHPQTNGLCERFNGTLKQMLRMLIESYGRDWEPYLPLLLFAYREVPQASTGFSPFELLYGRRVRGLLTLVRESWEGKTPTQGVPVVEYVLRLRERMQAMAALVESNMQQAQADQKQWYDQNARRITYEPGQKVWVLVPEPQDKFQAKWAGPYVVHSRIGEVTYLVTTDPDRGRHKTFHVNMMKAHHDREAGAYPVCSRLEEGEEEDLLDLLSQARGEGSSGKAQVGPELTETQRSQLAGVVSPLTGLFSTTPGRTTLAIHHVDTGDKAPVRRPAYRVSSAVQDQLRQEVDDMLELGVIQRSTSPWASPVVLVPKKDGTTRFCVDYRGLNKITVDDAYPMPRMDDLLDRLGKAQYLSIMDLSRGYWQIPLSSAGQERSAFITPFGLYESTVMPFGMKNAPATFQRMVNTLLEGCEGFAAAYLDDIAVFSSTWEDHLQHLNQVLGRIHQAGLTIKPEKCQLGMREVHYLGHRVGGGAVKTEPSKLDAIASWPTPRTKREVMSFLGLAGYYRRFVPEYSTLATPLTDLTKKRCPQYVTWTKDCEFSFGALKAALANPPVLQAFDDARPLVIQTDASDYGLGAVLSQIGLDGQEHPVQYLSRKLLPREVAYATVEKECLAIVWALRRLQPYLYGRHFTVETDHNPLTWINSVSSQNGRLTRWGMALQQYNFDIRHRPGSAHGNADGLSRRGGAVEVPGEFGVRPKPSLAPS